LAVTWLSNWLCVPRLRPFAIFYYLLSRAPSIFINLFSYILYFTLYYLLFVNYSFLVFFSPVFLCEKVWCGVYILLFFSCFLLPLFISQNPITSLFFIFYTSRPSRYARHRMRPVTIDVTWFLCVSVGYFTFCTNFKPFLYCFFDLPSSNLTYLPPCRRKVGNSRSMARSEPVVQLWTGNPLQRQTGWRKSRL